MTPSFDNLFMKYATCIAIATVTLVMAGTALVFYQQGQVNIKARTQRI